MKKNISPTLQACLGMHLRNRAFKSKSTLEETARTTHMNKIYLLALKAYLGLGLKNRAFKSKNAFWQKLKPKVIFWLRERKDSRSERRPMLYARRHYNKPFLCRLLIANLPTPTKWISLHQQYEHLLSLTTIERTLPRDSNLI